MKSEKTWFTQELHGTCLPTTIRKHKRRIGRGGRYWWSRKIIGKVRYAWGIPFKVSVPFW